MRPLGLTLTMTLTSKFQGQTWNLLYLSQKWFDCHETKSKHIDWTQGLKCDHGVWPWPWPWPWIFKVEYGICYISVKNGPIAMKRKANRSIELKASNVTMGFDLGHDLDLEFSRSNIEFAKFQSKVIRRSGFKIYKIVTGVTSDVGVPSTRLVIPPASTKLKGGYTGITLSVCLSVRLSVCGQNRVCSVSSTILIRSISYLHIISSNFRRCITCNARCKIKKCEILANFLNL